MRFVGVIAAGVALGVYFGCRLPAAAVEIPAGSYRDSCESIVLQGGFLSANCQDINGNWHQTTLDMSRCPGGPVANNNGQLACGPGGFGISRQMPRGSWRATCRNASEDGETLTAQCADASGGWHNTSIDYDDCSQHLIGNSNGNLVCEYGHSSAGLLPGGSWQASCRNGWMNGNILSANCQTGTGSWRDSSVDITACPGEHVANSGGYLFCESGRVHSVLPPGSWRQTCRNGYIEGAILRAECYDGNGNWRPVAFDLRTCYGPLGNDHGSLVCEGGPMYRRDQ